MPPCSGKVKSFDKFDSNFFGFTAKEVEYIDPQERKLLETTYEAICDAGKCQLAVESRSKKLNAKVTSNANFAQELCNFSEHSFYFPP